MQSSTGISCASIVTGVTFTVGSSAKDSSTLIVCTRLRSTLSEITCTSAPTATLAAAIPSAPSSDDKVECATVQLSEIIALNAKFDDLRDKFEDMRLARTTEQTS